MGNTHWLRDVQDVSFRRVYSQLSESGSDRAEYTPTDRYWEDHFCKVISRGKIHGSKDECFENAAYKVRALCIEQELLSIVDRAVKDPGIVEYGLNGLNIIVAHLLARGYLEHTAVVECAQNRIDAVYGGITEYGHDIYVGNGEVKGVPKAFQWKKIVKY